MRCVHGMWVRILALWPASAKFATHVRTHFPLFHRNQSVTIFRCGELWRSGLPCSGSPAQYSGSAHGRSRRAPILQNLRNVASCTNNTITFIIQPCCPPRLQTDSICAWKMKRCPGSGMYTPYLIPAVHVGLACQLAVCTCVTVGSRIEHTDSPYTHEHRNCSGFDAGSIRCNLYLKCVRGKPCTALKSQPPALNYCIDSQSFDVPVHYRCNSQRAGSWRID